MLTSRVIYGDFIVVNDVTVFAAIGTATGVFTHLLCDFISS